MKPTETSSAKQILHNSMAAITIAFLAGAKERKEVNNDVLKTLEEAKIH